jgi:hypothetical protein
MERKYRLICLKRSEFADRSNYEYHSDWWKASKIVYWRPNSRGYTSASEGAGLYTSSEIDKCAGDTGDWLVEPVNSTQIIQYEITLEDFS